MVCSSMGGWITHSAALFTPERIKKIVLLDPAAGIPTKTKWANLFLSAAIIPFKSNYRRITHKVLGNRFVEGQQLWFDYMVTVFACKAKPRLGMPSKSKSLQVDIEKMVQEESSEFQIHSHVDNELDGFDAATVVTISWNARQEK